jgi:signal transduction histidine kinase
VSIYWIRETAKDNRLQTSSLFVQNIAERLGGENDLEIPKNLDDIVGNKLQYFDVDANFCLYVIDEDGDLKYSMPQMTQQEFNQKWDYNELISPQSKFNLISSPVYGHSLKEVGKTVLIQSNQSLTNSESIITVIIIMLVIFTSAGLLTIYLLSSRLSLPLRQVTAATQRIEKGDYCIDNLQVKTQEREITQLVESFSGMATRLKQLEEWRILSLAGVSHELKTPVTSIKGLIHAVKDEVVTGEEAEEFLNLALQETGRLDRMVADLLDYNVFASGNVSMRSDRVELTGLLGEVVQQWELIDNHQEVKCELLIPEDEVYVMGDALRIRQIIVNLLNNCVQAKHSERKLMINVRLQCNTLDTEREQAILEIEDNGTGISHEDAPNIFERFYRGERKIARPHGLGLGLTYSQQLAQAQGGDLTLKSTSKNGSVFVVRFPIA